MIEATKAVTKRARMRPGRGGGGAGLHAVADDSVRRVAMSGFASIIVGSIAFAGILVGSGLFLSRPDLTYLAAAILLPVPLLGIGMLRQPKFDLFEPINITAGAVFFGSTLRGLYLVAFPDRPSAERLMLQQTFSDVNGNIPWIFAGLAAFCFGYLSFRHPGLKARLFSPRKIMPARYRSVLVICLGLSIAGCLAYVLTHGIDLRGDILGQSHKRSLIIYDELGDEVYASGWQSTLASVGLYAGAVLAGSMISRNLRATPYHLTLLGLLLAFGSVAPFFSSVRTPIILTVFSMFVFSYYYRRLNLKFTISGLLLLTLFVSLMGELRAFNSTGASGNASLIENVVGSGNGFDAVRATAILERVPQKSDYLYGRSYLAIPFFWVPRQVWPEKPEVGLGAWVKETLFGVRARQSGWPPGFVAEAYVNFGYVGIAVIPFLVGLLTRIYYEIFRPYLGRSFLATTFYSLIAYKIGFDIPSLNIAQGLVTGLLSALPATMIILVSSRRVIPTRRPLIQSAAVSAPKVSRAHRRTSTPTASWRSDKSR